MDKWSKIFLQTMFLSSFFSLSMNLGLANANPYKYCILKACAQTLISRPDGVECVQKKIDILEKDIKDLQEANGVLRGKKELQELVLHYAILKEALEQKKTISS